MILSESRHVLQEEHGPPAVQRHLPWKPAFVQLQTCQRGQEATRAVAHCRETDKRLIFVLVLSFFLKFAVFSHF